MHLFTIASCLFFVLAACGDDSGSSAPDAPAADAPGGSDAAPDCSAARAQLLGAVDSVSTGDVAVISQAAGTTRLYVDASAGGLTGGGDDPWTFVDLASGTKVAVTDVTSVSSTSWDLALKRPTLYTNDGDGGPGAGGAVLVAKAFAEVTAADAPSATFGTEAFFDATCAAQTDPTGAPLTTFATWYDYDPNTHVLSPHAGTWLVRGASGALYKLAIETYYANADGSEGTGDGGTYALDIAPL